LAVAAVKKLGPGVKRRRIWLVSVVGAAGCGKSHLARELVRGWEAEHPDSKLLLMTASQFAAQFADASATGTIPQFQSRYRKDVHLLICEDLQALGPRKESQAQLLAAIDEVVSQGGVVLLTSTRMPAAIKGLSRKLVNRIHGGLCVEMTLPGLESRRKLVQEYLSVESLPLTELEIETICENTSGSPRELIGLLTQLQMEMNLCSEHRQRSALNLGAKLAERQQTQKLTLPEIARTTADHFGVKLADMKGPHRGQTLSLARQTAMYLARELSELHYVQIGEFFNRGNHSTVIHACQKITNALLQRPDLMRQVQAIREELQPGKTSRKK